MRESLEHTRQCPHCGASLPEDAVFCPYCASVINSRIECKLPNPIWRKLIRVCILLVILAGVGLAIFLSNQPKTYDGTGEVIYTDKDGTYQIVFAWANNRYEPIYQFNQEAEEGMEYRFPCRMYVNHVSSGADASQAFMRKVDSVTAEFLPKNGKPSPLTCTEPAPTDYSPDAALVGYIDYIGQEGQWELLWTLHMNNGDTIRLRTQVILTLIQTYNYHWEDTPMDTLEELQALIDQIAGEVEPSAVVNIYLPPVRYEGSLVMEERPVNLYGSESEDGTSRTTFTETMRVASQGSWISYVENIDFLGNGEGVGISASARLHLTNCTIAGWKTGVLGYGYAWVNLNSCRVEDNEIGFHFNSIGGSVSMTQFPDNQFRRNGTGILLENVPTDVSISFNNTIFTENGTDIDNRCGQTTDLSGAIFQ